jgi:hypothetical protein
MAALVAHGGSSGEPQFYVDCDDVRGRTQNTRNFSEMERADDSVPDRIRTGVTGVKGRCPGPD